MEFKAGDRVHVKRFDGEKVNFYATLKNTRAAGVFYLINCTDDSYGNGQVYTPNSRHFGQDKIDYFELVKDEEDTEEPVIQRTNDMYNAARSKNYEIQGYIQHDPVNKPSHYMLGDIEVKDIIAIVADKYHKGSVAHNVASALEYQMRAPEKNGLEDIKKARKCLDFAIENWE